jgi:hypothetical protein
MEDKLTQEIAEKEFFDWAESLDIDCDVESMDSEELDDFNSIKKNIVFALRKGRLSIDEEGELSLKLKVPFGNLESLKFRNGFNSSAFIHMDRHKDKESMKKTLSFLGAWVGVDPKQLYKLDARDTKLCLKLITLFLA